MRRLRASVVVERRVPVIGWLILAAAVVSLSAMGTMVTLERSKPFTQSSWRAQSVLLIAAPWAAAKLKKQGLRGFRAARTRRRALLVALCWSGWFLTLFYGLATTSIAHAYVLTNTTSAVIVVHTLLTGNAVPRSHVAGVALAMAGAGVVMWQSSFQSSGDAKKNGASSGAATVAGDAVVAAGAVSGAAFLLLAKTTREEVELSLLLVLQMLVNLPISLALALSLEGCSFVTPLDAKRGVVGWLAPSQIGKQLVISVCGTIIGTCGYVASLKYLAPTVVAIAMLCEPILAALIGWAAGVNAFPDWKTCSGMALVALGTAVIAVDAGRARARAVDVDAHRNAANG
jgi:drug/metabolite transporter (DMT)-like permease